MAVQVPARRVIVLWCALLTALAVTSVLGPAASAATNPRAQVVLLSGQTVASGETVTSPDGHYALIVESHHPYSYELPFENFPKKTEVVDLRTGALKQLSDVPLADNIPLANDAVETGAARL